MGGESALELPLESVGQPQTLSAGDETSPPGKRTIRLLPSVKVRAWRVPWLLLRLASSAPNLCRRRRGHPSMRHRARTVVREAKQSRSDSSRWWCRRTLFHTAMSACSTLAQAFTCLSDHCHSIAGALTVRPRTRSTNTKSAHKPL